MLLTKPYAADSAIQAAKTYALKLQMLLTKPYAEQVVICPHVYGPAVTHSSQGTTGQGLFQRLSASFGYLTQQGLTGPNGNKASRRCYCLVCLSQSVCVSYG